MRRESPQAPPRRLGPPPFALRGIFCAPPCAVAAGIPALRPDSWRRPAPPRSTRQMMCVAARRARRLVVAPGVTLLRAHAVLTRAAPAAAAPAVSGRAGCQARGTAGPGDAGREQRAGRNGGGGPPRHARPQRAPGAAPPVARPALPQKGASISSSLARSGSAVLRRSARAWRRRSTSQPLFAALSAPSAPRARRVGLTGRRARRWLPRALPGRAPADMRVPTALASSRTSS